MENSKDFKDILIPRREPLGIITFMTRKWDPKKTMEININSTPQDVKNIAANSAFLDHIIEQESFKTGTCKEKLQEQVKEYLDQIGVGAKIPLVRLLGFMFLNMTSWMKVGLYVNEPQILKLRESMGKNPIIFLPTHRSYADVTLMTYLSFQYQIQVPAVAAAMDLSSMAVLGKILQETCAFYIRRTLIGAPLYEATLKQYVRTLITSYNAPVQFFLEGTRSRSNKSVAPKYGMLSMSLQPLFSGEVDDIITVPIHISYDRLVEQWHFAYEHLGMPKPKETTGSFLNALCSINDHFGNIYINIGTPVSLSYYTKKEFKALDPSATADQLSAERFKQVQKIADHVVTLQQKYMVTNISNLIATVLMESLVTNKPLTLEEVVKEVKWLMDVVRSLGAFVLLDDVVAEVERVLVVHSKIMTIDNDGKLRLYASELINVSEQLTRRMKGHTLKVETVINAVPVIQLQQYVNPILYYLVPPALICVIVTKGSISEEQLSLDWHRIRTLIKYEFFYDERDEDETFRKAIEYCLQNKVIAESEGSYSLGAEERVQYLLKWTICPALTTLLKCADVMTELWKCEHKKALKTIQEHVEMTKCHPYCLSLDVAANCLKGLVLAKALNRHKGDEIVYELEPTAMSECRQMITALLPSFDMKFGVKNSVILDQRNFSSM